MFFYIGKTSPLTSLNQVAENVFIDKGWNSINVNGVEVWYKGYSTECNLNLSIPSIIEGYQPRGKWCAIVKKETVIEIKHPVHRGFPLYTLEECFTNLKLPNFNHCNFSLPEPKLLPQLSMDEATISIGDIVLENIENFYKFNSISKMNVLFSGGLDTLTVWALLDTLTPIYNLDVYIPKQGDNVLAKWSNATSDYDSDLIDHARKNYWGYEISRLYSTTNWNITGFYSERHQLREVTNGLAYAHYLNKTVNDLLTETDYLYHFLNRPDIASRKIDLPNFIDEQHVKNWCYHSITSDDQMWHLDNNFHFSPLFDSRITDVAYRLSLNDLIFNLRHGHIQKKIIERFRPNFLQLLSDYKNAMDIYGNFKKNWRNVRLNPETKVTIR
jgi:hypothetical protein